MVGEPAGGSTTKNETGVRRLAPSERRRSSEAVSNLSATHAVASVATARSRACAHLIPLRFRAAGVDQGRGEKGSNRQDPSAPRGGSRVAVHQSCRRGSVTRRVAGQVAGGGGCGDGVEQRGADRGTHLLAGADGGSGHASEAWLHSQGGVAESRDHGARRAQTQKDLGREHGVQVVAAHRELGEQGHPGGGHQQPRSRQYAGRPAARKLRGSGWLHPDEMVVVINTGAGTLYSRLLREHPPVLPKGARIPAL